MTETETIRAWDLRVGRKAVVPGLHGPQVVEVVCVYHQDHIDGDEWRLVGAWSEGRTLFAGLPPDAPVTVLVES